MRPSLKSFVDKIAGRPVYILGGGASVTQSVINKIQDRPVFCLNSSINSIESPLGVMWCDDLWVSDRYESISSMSIPKFQVRSNVTHDHILKDIKGPAGGILIGREAGCGYTKNIDYVKGNNTGCFAINFLINCGVSELYLLGYDLKHSHGRSHYHNDYKNLHIQREIYSETFMSSFKSLHEGLKLNRLDKRIINMNKESAIPYFQKWSYDDL